MISAMLLLDEVGVCHLFYWWYFTTCAREELCPLVMVGKIENLSSGLAWPFCQEKPILQKDPDKMEKWVNIEPGK